MNWSTSAHRVATHSAFVLVPEVVVMLGTAGGPRSPNAAPSL
jgi:nucleoside phosphorylase